MHAELEKYVKLMIADQGGVPVAGNDNDHFRVQWSAKSDRYDRYQLLPERLRWDVGYDTGVDDTRRRMVRVEWFKLYVVVTAGAFTALSVLVTHETH